MPVTTISCSSGEPLAGAEAVAEVDEVAAAGVAEVVASAAAALSAAIAGKFELSAAAATSKVERRRIVGMAIPPFF